MKRISKREFTLEQLAKITDKALDDAFGYGLSAVGENFGWLSNLESVKSATDLIYSGETDIERISAAIHDGWSKIAKQDMQGILNLDKETPLEKKNKRMSLASKSYGQLPEEEKEKDRIIAKVLLEKINK